MDEVHAMMKKEGKPSVTALRAATSGLFQNRHAYVGDNGRRGINDTWLCFNERMRLSQILCKLPVAM